MATTESLDTANKITIELVLHGYIRLHILPNCTATDIPLKVFNILLSTFICNNITTCSILKNCLNILQQYDTWVNVEKKPKNKFVCNLPLNITNSKQATSPTQLIETYFDHISNLHGLTYQDYDKLHKYCTTKLYNKGNTFSNISNTSILNECLSMNCLILNDEQKTELEKLTFGIGSGSASYESQDFSIQSNSLAFHGQKSNTIDSKDEHADEADDYFPELPTTFNVGRHSQPNSSIASFLAPNWKKSSKQSTSLRSKWQKHVAAASSTDVSQFISQLSVLSLLPTISDEYAVNDEYVKEKDNILPPSPTSPNMAISVKSYKFLFDGINVKSNETNIGFREVCEMSVNPFDLLSQISNFEDNSDIQIHKKSKKYEYEFRTQLRGILNEMDLMGDGVLDMADFSTGLMSIVKDDMYDFMSVSMNIFDDDELNKNDMDAAKIDDIISLILNSNNDQIIGLKELICKGLKIEMIEEDENENENENKEIELGGLELKEKEKIDEPYKPIYQVTSGIQRFGKAKENKVDKKGSNENKENKVNDKEIVEKKDINDIGDLPNMVITQSIVDSELSDALDKIHIYLFHAVHDVREIPL
eukprot:96670_1